MTTVTYLEVAHLLPLGSANRIAAAQRVLLRGSSGQMLACLDHDRRLCTPLGLVEIWEAERGKGREGIQQTRRQNSREP